MASGDLRVLIVDDEPPARSRLAQMVTDTGGWQVVGEAGNGTEALQAVESERPDLVLLDIRMPGMDGIEVAGHLCALPAPPAVVFTTAYDEYAVQAFDANAVGYLLKPVRRERLLQALERAARVHRWQLSDLVNTHPELCARQHIPVTSGSNVKLVSVADVMSFHADQKYVRMVHSGGESLIDEPLKALEDEFAEDFVRLHRNSLVRITAIKELTRDDNGQYQARVAGSPGWLPVSRRHVSDVKQSLRSVSA